MFGTGEMFSHEAARLLGRLFDAFYVMRRPRVTSTWTYPVAHMMNVSPTLTCLGKRVTSVSEGGGDQTALAFLAGMSAAKMMLGEPVPYEELLFPRNKKSLQRWVAGISSSWLQRISTEMCLDNDRALDAKARDVVRPSWL
jgi:hypothetical protein